MSVNSRYLITVPIPTFNRKTGLRRAIESVTNQQIDGILIHIFDNCSTDGTEAIIEELMLSNPDLKYTRRPSNLGALANYMDALSTIETPYYIPLADDDWLLEGSISKLLDVMENDSSLGAAVSKTRWESEQGICTKINPGKEWEFRKYEPSELIPLWVKRGHFEWSSILFRTSAAKAIGGPDIKAGLVWDVDFQLQLFLRYPIQLVEHETAVYLIHPDQGSRQIGELKWNGIVAVLGKVTKNRRSKEFPAETNSALKTFTLRWLRNLATEIVHFGQFSNLLEMLGKLRRDLSPTECAFLVYSWLRKKIGKLRDELIKPTHA